MYIRKRRTLGFSAPAGAGAVGVGCAIAGAGDIAGRRGLSVSRGWEGKMHPGSGEEGNGGSRVEIWDPILNILCADEGGVRVAVEELEVRIHQKKKDGRDHR